MGVPRCAQVGTDPKEKPQGPKSHLRRRLAARDALIFPHLPPEQDAKLAASAGVTECHWLAELQDIELAANSQWVSDRLYSLLAAGEGDRCPNRVWAVRKLQRPPRT